MTDPCPDPSTCESSPTDPQPDERPAPIRCDFCSEEAISVRRVALDGDYDRLASRHQALYACPDCSERKERQRIGLDRNADRG
jgi:hypothetical protein